MEAFLKRKREKSPPAGSSTRDNEDDSTDMKLAILSSLFPDIGQEALLEALLAHDGSVEAASAGLANDGKASPKKSRLGSVVGYQSSLKLFAAGPSNEARSPSPKKSKVLSRKGTTIRLYDPEDIEEHTPCTIVHNFLPQEEANDLLKELLEEAKTFEKGTFKMFDNVVTSPHTATFYVETQEERDMQKLEYVYNGARMTDVRKLTPQLLKIKPKVQEAVNREIQRRMQTRHPMGKKLKYQSPDPWVPNSAFVNCYNGPQESVGFHSDQLTYLGPRPIIGSLSLGVAREFRVKRIVPKDQDNQPTDDPDAEGQISIHLPHNSLLVMHAEMQEEWKHSIAPAQAIDPHPIAGNRRINVTYRDYRESMHPTMIPRCKCGIPSILRVVQRKKENWGKYFWMCYGGNVPGKEGCTFFQWAEFDEDGNPSWDRVRYKGRPSAVERRPTRTDFKTFVSAPQNQQF